MDLLWAALFSVPWVFGFCWLYFGFWTALQFTIIIFVAIATAAVASAFIGTDAAKYVLFLGAAAGFFPARWATKRLSAFIDRRSGQDPPHG